MAATDAFVPLMRPSGTDRWPTLEAVVEVPAPPPAPTLAADAAWLTAASAGDPRCLDCGGEIGPVADIHVRLIALSCDQCHRRGDLPVPVPGRAWSRMWLHCGTSTRVEIRDLLTASLAATPTMTE